MNDYQMSFLVEQHRSTLLAEADRERRVREARTATPRRRRSEVRARHQGLGLLFGRLALR